MSNSSSTKDDNTPDSTGSMGTSWRGFGASHPPPPLKGHKQKKRKKKGKGKKKDRKKEEKKGKKREKINQHDE